MNGKMGSECVVFKRIYKQLNTAVVQALEEKQGLRREIGYLSGRNEAGTMREILAL